MTRSAKLGLAALALFSAAVAAGDDAPGTVPRAYREFLAGRKAEEIPHRSALVHDSPRLATLGRCIRIGKGGLFARVAIHDGVFWGFYGGRDGCGAVAFDADWKPLKRGHWLTPEGEDEIDQDIAFDETGVYQFAMLKGCAGLVRKFDWDFKLVAQTEVFRGGDGETIMDQHISAFGGRVYAGTEYRERPERWGKGCAQNLPPDARVGRGVHVRIYDPNLKLLDERDLKGEASGAAAPGQCWGLGANQVSVGGRHCVITASSIGDCRDFDRGESVGARQIYALRFDPGFAFVDSVGPLSDTACDNFWPTGAAVDGDRVYLSYTVRAPGSGSILGPNGGGPDNGWIRLGIFDREFRELETIEITPREGESDRGEWHRSDVIVVGQRAYVAFDGPGGAWVREVIFSAATPQQDRATSEAPR